MQWHWLSVTYHGTESSRRYPVLASGRNSFNLRFRYCCTYRERNMGSERSGEVQLAIFVGSKIADGIVGGAATELVANPVLKFLGIKQVDDSAARYHQEVMSQLKSLGQSLSTQIQALQDTLVQITGLSSEVKDYMTHEALKQILRSFNNEAATIQTSFRLFVDDVSTLSAKDDKKTERALKDLFDVLSPANAIEVSGAMSRIHDLVVPPSELDDGILSYLNDVVREK